MNDLAQPNRRKQARVLKKPKRVWRRMDYADAVDLVESALEAYLEERNLEVYDIDDTPERAEIARWAWARRFTWKWSRKKRGDS